MKEITKYKTKYFIICHGKIFVQIFVEHDNMIPESKGHTFHALMKKYEFETRKTGESSPNRAKFECF